MTTVYVIFLPNIPHVACSVSESVNDYPRIVYEKVVPHHQTHLTCNSPGIANFRSFGWLYGLNQLMF